MSQQDARTEVVEMGETPGQKISYQIGKLQIMQMLSEAQSKQGAQFSLRDFHDYVWQNGNIPIALLRWEFLGMADEVRELDGPLYNRHP